MTALPIEHDDLLDPVRILEDLPGDERDAFVAEYRRLADAARDLEGWAGLHQYLRRMRGHAEMAKRPGYRERAEAVMRPVSESGGMSLEEAVRRYRPPT